MIVFVTGTDTGVGKTFYSVALCKALKSRGFKVGAFKPIETGCQPNCSDANALKAVADVWKEPSYSFKTPVAPSVASLIEKVDVDLEVLERDIKELERRCDFLIVEGAGGLLVPIKGKFTYLELVEGLKPQATAIVALNKLGVINHTLLTVKVLECRGLSPSFVVLNTLEKFDESVDTNYDTLSSLLSVPVFLFSSSKDAKKIAEFLEKES